MIISSTVTGISGKSEQEIKAYVEEVQAKGSARPCILCNTNHDVIAQMLTISDRFIFLPVCRGCLKKHTEDLKDFIRNYCIESA